MASRIVLQSLRACVARSSAPRALSHAPIRSLYSAQIHQAENALARARERKAANVALASSDHGLAGDMATAELEATPSLPPGAPVAQHLSDPFLSQTKNTFEIKDAELIFRQVWNTLLSKYGEENLVFPKEIMSVGT
jgi:hypothetical protein